MARCLLVAGALALAGAPRGAADDTAVTSIQSGATASWTEPAEITPGQPVPPPAPIPPAEPPPVAEAPDVNVNGARPSIGRPDVAPIVEVRTTYDDNIFISPTGRKSDFYTTAVAGLAVGWGDFRDQLIPLGAYQETFENLRTPDFDSRQFLFASYTPGYTAFVTHSDQNSVDQNATLGAKWSFGNLTCDIRATYRLFSEALVDAGTRIRQSQFNVSADSQYQFSARTGLEVDLNLITHHFDQSSQVDSSEWIDRNYLNYQVMPKTQISAGLVLGYVDLQTGPSQTYEQGLARVSYDTGHKTSANLFGGVEFRQFTEGGKSSTNPVFGVQAVYTPADGTTIQLSASRLVTNSAEYVAQDIVATGVALAVSQEVFKKVTLTLQGSYRNDRYGDTVGGADVQRTDDGLGLEASIAFHLTTYLAVNLAYDYLHNSSTAEAFNFDDNRATIDLDLLF